MANDLQRADKGVSGILKALVMSSTDRANNINRSVTEYLPCSVDAFFDPDMGVYNAVVSGGDRHLRTKAMIAQAECATKNNFPVVILHEGNHELENQMRSTFANRGIYFEISDRFPCFEPFYGLNALEISNQILETASKDNDIKYNARYYIEGMIQFLSKSGKHPWFQLLSTCPHSLLFDKVDDLYLQGRITDSEGQEIKSKLMLGQSENYKIDSYMANLKMEMMPIMFTPKKSIQPVNILTAIKKNAVVCIDIVSITNKLLMNTLIFQLKLALTRGMQYTLLIDSIPTNSNDAYVSFLKSSTDKVCKMIASDDFYAMTGGDEKVFTTLIGESQILIVLSHTSSNSAVKWSEVFGQYDKYEQTYSTSYGSSKRTPFSILSSPSKSRQVSINKNREYVVKPEMITRMGYGEAYVLTAARGELAHLVLNG